MSPETDAAIVQLVLDGDKDSYARLVDAYSARIINYLSRMTGNRYEAEELAQEAFVRAYFALRSFNPDYKFSSWLYKIATNLCINHLKKRRRWVHMDDYQDEQGQATWVPPDTSADCNPVKVVAQQELKEQIVLAIGQLPQAYRAVIVLRHVHGLSYQEIAEITDLPIGTVKSRLGRGRSRLVVLLQGAMPGEDEC
jgi:RNA polymerase sigma-70 factor (ECF subfamily)